MSARLGLVLVRYQGQRSRVGASAAGGISGDRVPHDNQGLQRGTRTGRHARRRAGTAVRIPGAGELLAGGVGRLDGPPPGVALDRPLPGVRLTSRVKMPRSYGFFESGLAHQDELAGRGLEAAVPQAVGKAAACTFCSACRSSPDGRSSCPVRGRRRPRRRCRSGLPSPCGRPRLPVGGGFGPGDHRAGRQPRRPRGALDDQRTSPWKAASPVPCTPAARERRDQPGLPACQRSQCPPGRRVPLPRHSRNSTGSATGDGQHAELHHQRRDHPGVPERESSSRPAPAPSYAHRASDHAAFPISLKKVPSTATISGSPSI